LEVIGQKPVVSHSVPVVIPGPDPIGSQRQRGSGTGGDAGLRVEFGRGGILKRSEWPLLPRLLS